MAKPFLKGLISIMVGPVAINQTKWGTQVHLNFLSLIRNVGCDATCVKTCWPFKSSRLWKLQTHGQPTSISTTTTLTLLLRPIPRVPFLSTNYVPTTHVPILNMTSINSKPATFTSLLSIWASFCCRSASSPLPWKSTRNKAVILSMI